MPVSTEFLRGVLGVLCVFFAHMTGRSAGAVRQGRQKVSRLYGWALRTVLCAAILIFRHEIDGVAIGVWALSAVAFASGMWDVARARRQEDLTHEIFPGVRPFLCEPYLERLREETADAASGAALVAHLWSRGSLDARFDTLLLPVLLPESVDPVAHLTARGLPEDFARERLHAGGCLILLDRADAALERQYPRCIFVTDADALLQFGR